MRIVGDKVLFDADGGQAGYRAVKKLFNDYGVDIYVTLPDGKESAVYSFDWEDAEYPRGSDNRWSPRDYNRIVVFDDSYESSGDAINFAEWGYDDIYKGAWAKVSDCVDAGYYTQEEVDATKAQADAQAKQAEREVQVAAELLKDYLDKHPSVSLAAVFDKLKGEG